MCTTWNDQQWLEGSKPADPTSIYELVGELFNANGDVARLYSANDDGGYYGVMPGHGNYYYFDSVGEYTGKAQATHYLEAHGYTLREAPSTKAIDEVIPADLVLV